MKRRGAQHPSSRGSGRKPASLTAVSTVDAAPQLVEIEKPIYGGAFLARSEGKAVFVPLALPGEQVRVRIAQDKRGYATVEAEEIVAASPLRIAAGCPHFGTCGGCNYQHAGYETQLAFKQAILRETLERGGVKAPDEIVALSAEPWAYRNRIRVAFDAQGNPGYRGRRSHGIFPIRECPIAAPLLVKAALAFAEIARPLAGHFRPMELALFCDAERVTEGQSGKLAWDLFAGVGLFARRLASGFERVVAVESAPASEKALRANLAGTSGEAVSGDTLAFLHRRKAEKPDLIVVDPPRTGLGAEITAALGAVAAKSLVYVSCDPATLARDLRVLVAGGYRIEALTLADLFPQTFHLETIVRLARV